MKNSLRILTIIGLSSIFMIDSTHAATLPTLTKESNIAIATIANQDAKKWARSEIKQKLQDINKVNKKRENRIASLLLKKEMILELESFISKIKNKNYTFDISSTEREKLESLVIGYQKDFLAPIKLELEKYLNNDVRESGNMKFSVKTKEYDIAIQFDEIRATVSKDTRNMIFETRLSINATEHATKNIYKIVLDGNITVIGQDVYISLKNYELKLPNAYLIDIDEIKDTLEKLKGKTFHQKLDERYGEYLLENVSSSQIIRKTIIEVIAILEKKSLFTPITKEGNSYILGANTTTIRNITNIIKNQDYSMHNSEMDDILIGGARFPEVSLPFQMTTDGTSIRFHVLDAYVRIDGTISRSESQVATINANINEVGTKYPLNISVKTTPTDLQFTGSVTDYLFDFTGNKNKILATLKKSNKTIGTLKVDSTGFDAWTYDLSAIWDYTSYNWESDTDETESIVLSFFANIRREFGQYSIFAPTPSTELSSLDLR